MKRITKKLKNNGGFTLVEVLATMALYSIVLLMIMGVLLPAVKTWARYADKDNYAAFLQYAQEAVTERIRYADEIRVTDALSADALDADEREKYAVPRNYIGVNYLNTVSYDVYDGDGKSVYLWTKNLYVEKIDAATGEPIGYQSFSAPVKPKNDARLIISIEQLSDAEPCDLLIKMEFCVNDKTRGLLSGETVIAKAEFTVRAINMKAKGVIPEISETTKGKQAIYIH